MTNVRLVSFFSFNQYRRQPFFYGSLASRPRAGKRVEHEAAGRRNHAAKPAHERDWLHRRVGTSGAVGFIRFARIEDPNVCIIGSSGSSARSAPTDEFDREGQLTTIHYNDGAFFALDVAQDHLAPLAELGWPPHASKIGWFTRSPYLAGRAVELGIKEPGPAPLRRSGHGRGDFKTSFADALIRHWASMRSGCRLASGLIRLQIAAVQRRCCGTVLRATKWDWESHYSLAVANMVRPQRMIIGCRRSSRSTGRRCANAGWSMRRRSAYWTARGDRSRPRRGHRPLLARHDFARQILAGPGLIFV